LRKDPSRKRSSPWCSAFCRKRNNTPKGDDGVEKEKLFYRMLDVIEGDIVPLTARGVAIGCKVFGAAGLRKDDLSLVVAGTNHEAFSPLWHGEVYTIKLFYELQGHPDPSECIFLSTHEPCSMCISALAWAGFREIYYFFGYEQTQDVFNIPHDLRMLREVFGCVSPTKENISVALTGTLPRLYFPSASVMVPLLVPLITTVTPGKEEPEESVTRPKTLKDCCWTVLLGINTMLEPTMPYFTSAPLNITERTSSTD